jgi:hypothetical protein
MNRDGRPRLYSDFRAVGSDAFVRVTRRQSEPTGSTADLIDPSYLCVTFIVPDSLNQ